MARDAKKMSAPAKAAKSAPPAAKNGVQKTAKAFKPVVTHSEELPLDADLLLAMHDTMIKARCLEERLIQMYKTGHGYFWIGGPGEEAFNVPLGMLVKKGQGPAFDYLHFHYRQSATLLAMGEIYFKCLLRQRCHHFFLKKPGRPNLSTPWRRPSTHTAPTHTCTLLCRNSL